MKVEEFTKSCLRTWRYDFNNTSSEKMEFMLRVSNAGLGLVGEVGEAYKTPTITEIGDVLYYVAVICHELKIKFPQVGPADGRSNYSSARSAALEVAELIKKHVFHGKDKTEEIEAELEVIVFSFLRSRSDKSRQMILDGNISKLRKRWPDGFTVTY